MYTKEQLAEILKQTGVLPPWVAKVNVHNANSNAYERAASGDIYYGDVTPPSTLDGVTYNQTLSRPTIGTVTKTQNSVTIPFTLPAGYTSTRWDVSLNSNFSTFVQQNVEKTTSPAVFTGLSAETTYYFRPRAERTTTVEGVTETETSRNGATITETTSSASVTTFKQAIDAKAAHHAFDMNEPSGTVWVNNSYTTTPGDRNGVYSTNAGAITLDKAPLETGTAGNKSVGMSGNNSAVSFASVDEAVPWNMDTEAFSVIYVHRGSMAGLTDRKILNVGQSRLRFGSGQSDATALRVLWQRDSGPTTTLNWTSAGGVHSSTNINFIYFYYDGAGNYKIYINGTDVTLTNGGTGVLTSRGISTCGKVVYGAEHASGNSGPNLPAPGDYDYLRIHRGANAITPAEWETIYGLKQTA